MKRILTVLLCLVVAGMIIVTAVSWLWGNGGNASSGGGYINTFSYLDNAQGFTVTVGEDGEFPSAPDLTVEEMEAELDAIVAFAKESGFNSIFFTVNSGRDAYWRTKVLDVNENMTAEDGLFSKFDALEYIGREANGQMIQVFGVLDVSTFSTGAEDVDTVSMAAAELARSYPLVGVVLSGMPAGGGDTLSSAINTVSQSVKSTGRETTLGLMFDSGTPGGITPEMIAELTKSEAVDTVIPQITASVDQETDDYQTQLFRWLDAVQGSAKLYTGNAAWMVAGTGGYSDPEELSYQLFLNTITQGVSGAVLDSYSDLRGNRADTELLVSFLAAGTGENPLEGLSLNIPRTLNVTYPQNGFRTSGRTVYIMGTSDPGVSLTMNGQEVKRISEGGTFGVKVDLSVGENTYTFRQGEKVSSVTIVRYTPSTTPEPINNITKSSIFPQVPNGVDSNATVVFSCVGPAGGKVTATLNGRTVELTAPAAASNGTPVTFSGKMELNPGDYPAGSTTNIGKTTYVLSYNGVNSTSTSVGDTYVAGSNVQLQVRLISQLANVLEEVGDDDTVYATLKEKAVVPVTGSERTTREGVGTIGYRLADGGYVLGGNVEIVAGEPVSTAKVEEVTTQLLENGEILHFSKDTPGLVVTRKDNGLVLDFYDTVITADPDMFTSSFFDLMTTEKTTSGSRVTLRLRPGASFWGYNVEYTDEGLQLFIRSTPVRSATYGKPLEGITIMLDAGHGGVDPGALGVAYETGPDEADLNLAVALATRYRLEQLGATVVMTRVDDLSEDARFTIVERNVQAEEVKPDIFISLHHNSANLTSDLSNATWMECYYFEEDSELLASTLLDRLGPMLGRDTQDPEWARFYVTRLTFAPSVLLEIGYMVNPVNYEDCSDSMTIFKTACGIARSVVDMIPEAPAVVEDGADAGSSEAVSDSGSSAAS